MIYFCIPALNEERTVGVVLWKLRQVMTELQRDFQIVVVDDASTDASQEVLSPYVRVLPLTLIRNEQQLGYAASLEIALREAVRRSPYPKRDAIVTLQADFTEDPDQVPALIKRIEAGADLVTSEPRFDDGTPPNVRRARRFFRWLVRGREWAQLADPFSGLRAYRVMTIKRAIETRGTARLLSWEGIAANAELLAQSIPHSRRNDTIESDVHYKRLQRLSRFRFLGMLSQVLGVRSGKLGRAVPVELPESTIVVPAALAVELAHTHRREEMRRHPAGPRRSSERGRGSEQRRARRPPRPPREGNREDKKEPRRPRDRGPRPARAEAKPRPAPAPATAPTPEEVAAIVPAPEREKKRRRSRRRSRKPSQRAEQQGTTTEAPANGEAAPAEMTAENGTSGGDEMSQAPRKKSRRGRRGGRGRRRGPRPHAAGGEEQSNNNGGEGPADAAQYEESGS